ncbi:hypothetical protein AAP_06004 [Ascosphaera apis ARSEF 7405]|uniref:Uncharacterized protein n=1 Tax=Ascosphaera apis ARSEF 7405 TaxID=392613 RepID=A0A167V536_9EURO|nr:hypothetical protein AAP_06004 [Ascosphaera apis ARSEF 7405]
MTGNEVTVNLVKKRYYRLKATFTVFNDDDIPRLLEADKAVDAKIEQIEKDRCNLIARDIAGAGGESYSVATIQKKLKEIKRT